MKLRLLHLAASPRPAESRSRQVGAAFIDSLRAAWPGLQLVERDLGRRPPPYPDADFVAASLAWPEGDPAALALSESLIAELREADAVLVTTPMHNFTVPSALKTWIDLVLRPGRTFANTASGKQPLLDDRPLWVIAACGGPLGEAPGAQPDFLTPYLRHVFATIGLRNMEMLRLDRLRRAEMRNVDLVAHSRGWIDAQVRRLQAPGYQAASAARS